MMSLLKASATRMMTLEKVQEHQNTELIDLKLKSMSLRPSEGAIDEAGIRSVLQREVAIMRDQSLNFNVDGLQKSLEESERRVQALADD